MKQIDNYIVEKLHISKDTKNVADFYEVLCGLFGRDNKINSIKHTFAVNMPEMTLSVLSLDDVYIVTPNYKVVENKLKNSTYFEYIVNDNEHNELLDFIMAECKHCRSCFYEAGNSNDIIKLRKITNDRYPVGVEASRWSRDNSHLEYTIYFLDKNALSGRFHK